MSGLYLDIFKTEEILQFLGQKSTKIDKIGMSFQRKRIYGNEKDE